MIDRNILLPELIYNSNGIHSGPILRYDNEYQITTGIKTDGFFQRISVRIENWFDSSKQWISVKTRDGTIVYLQKSKASFDRTDRTRPEVVEALFVEKVWKDRSGQRLQMKEFKYESISARAARDPNDREAKRPNELINGYLLLPDGTLYIKEPSKRESGAAKTKKNVVDVKTGKHLARLVTKKQNSRQELEVQTKRVRAEYDTMEELKGTSAQKSVPEVHSFLMGVDKEGNTKISILEDLFDTSLPETGKKLPKYIEKKHFKEIAEQLIFGLKAIHENGIAHSDIKGPNLLIRKEPDGTIRAVFTDFDRALKIDKNPKFGRNPVQGTLQYFSQEKVKAIVDRKRSFSFEDECKADVWALGLELYRLRNGVYPKVWKEAIVNKSEKEQLRQAILSLKQETFLTEPEEKDSVDHLIWEMLQIDSNARPSMADVCKRWAVVNR